MPELPDVEGFRRVLSQHAVGSRIERVEVLDAGVLRGVSARSLRDSLRGRRFGSPRRHGKWLIAPLLSADKASGGGDAPAVMLHFGMTGALEWARRSGDDPAPERHRHDRVVFALPGGELRYRDMRKLQGLRLARQDHDIDRILDELGPDAGDVTLPQLRELLTRRGRQLKPALVDQSLIAGLGNLLADEILWRARIHPRTSTTALGDAELRRLHRSLKSVLKQSIPTGRVPPRPSWLTGRRDEPSGSCPRCGATLSRGRTGGRGTVWCPKCQPAP